MMVEDKPVNWLDVVLRGASGPEPPTLDSARIKELAGRALLTPREMSEAEVQEMAAAIISHLVRSKAG